MEDPTQVEPLFSGRSGNTHPGSGNITKQASGNDGWTHPSQHHPDTVDNYRPDNEARSLTLQRKQDGLENDLKQVKQKLQTEEALQVNNRVQLRRFEALSLDNQYLTSLSIGGYAVDLSKAAQKASEVVPLPAAKLPIIFGDQELNFYHHFFQGLEVMLGRTYIESLVANKSFDDRIAGKLSVALLTMIKEGYKQSDTELTLFVKKVVTSTFDTVQNTGDAPTDNLLSVAANLWGFQYIESGMQMKNADLEMWMSISYAHYRNIWFNTFKSAGVPAFAMEGVQTRYADLAQDLNALKEKYDQVQMNYATLLDETAHARKSESRRAYRHQREDEEFGAMIRRSGHQRRR